MFARGPKQQWALYLGHAHSDNASDCILPLRWKVNAELKINKLFCLAKKISKHCSVQIALWSFLITFSRFTVKKSRQWSRKLGKNVQVDKEKCELIEVVDMVAVDKLAPWEMLQSLMCLPHT